jgi:hypothetical protein
MLHSKDIFVSNNLNITPFLKKLIIIVNTGRSIKSSSGFFSHYMVLVFLDDIGAENLRISN